MANSHPRRKYTPRHWTLQRKLDHLSADDSSGCRLWTAGKDEWGYGMVRYRGKMLKAHRAAWQIRYGSIPKGKIICHHCDTPACINVDHLFLGTDADNKNDSVLKRRHAHGSRNRHAKITEAIARAVFATKGSQRIVGLKFGVSGTTVCQIRNKKAWKYIHEET